MLFQATFGRSRAKDCSIQQNTIERGWLDLKRTNEINAGN
jgi:hypothetical protein